MKARIKNLIFKWRMFDFHFCRCFKFNSNIHQKYFDDFSWSTGLLSGKGNRIEAKRSEEHTSELQSQSTLVCRLLLEKNKPQPPDRLCPARAPATPPPAGTARCPR